MKKVSLPFLSRCDCGATAEFVCNPESIYSYRTNYTARVRCTQCGRVCKGYYRTADEAAEVWNNGDRYSPEEDAVYSKLEDSKDCATCGGIPEVGPCNSKYGSMVAFCRRCGKRSYPGDSVEDVDGYWGRNEYDGRSLRYEPCPKCKGNICGDDIQWVDHEGNVAPDGPWLSHAQVDHVKVTCRNCGFSITFEDNSETWLFYDCAWPRMEHYIWNLWNKRVAGTRPEEGGRSGFEKYFKLSLWRFRRGSTPRTSINP